MPKVTAKPDFAQAQEAMQAWWRGSSLGRPAVSCRLKRPDAPPPPEDPRPRRQLEQDPQWYLALARWELEAFDYPLETMPGLAPQYGHNLVVPATLVGGQLQYRPETTWILPMPDVYERALPAFSPEHPTFHMLEATLRLMLQELGQRGLISAPVVLDGLTTLSSFRDSGPLCMDLIDRPADVKRTAGELNKVLLAAHAAFFKTLAAAGHAHTVTWCGIYAPGKAEMVQCDFGIMLSPAMYEEFVMPDLARLTEYFDYSCYHLDGTPQVRFLEQLCSLPRLHAIQWNPEPGAAPPAAWVDFFQQVRRRKRSLFITTDIENALEITRQLGPDGLMFQLRGPQTAQQLDEAVAKLKKVS